MINNKDMEIRGKVIAVLDKQSGVSSRGNSWEKLDFVIETEEQYPSRICFTLFNKCELTPKVGDIVDVGFDIKANEYKGKWYNSLMAWKVSSSGSSAVSVHTMSGETQPSGSVSHDDVAF